MRKECPICKSKRGTILKKLRLTIPEYFHLPNEYDIVVCEDCGFCYASMEATVEDYDYYYSHCNSYAGTPTEAKGKTEFNQKVAEIVSNFARRDDFLLDIGFGKGNFMRLLREKGFNNVHGMDPASDSVKQMQNENFAVYEGSIFGEIREDLKNKYDFVFLFDVLEHLLYPDAAIENVSGYLKKDGYLFISVPNYADLFESDSILVNEFNQEHINYFSSVSLENLLKSKNFCKYDGKIEMEGLPGRGILSVFRYMGKVDMEKNLLKDEICKKSIQTYIQRNNELERIADEKLISFCKEFPSVYIWGTGAYAMWLLANTRLGSMNIEAFIDNNCTKIGKELIKKPIISAEEISEENPIIICCMRFSTEIEDQIKNLNLTNQYIVL